ncbi:MAG TPA: DUF4397 domain-containing protein [Chitinophaga sp.]|uniref:DUF4397 domain-containing protein n=1 Tax=Chitinophaga sp. TaxID=1869181 RepID=UPI002C20A4E2|nr:DUF4397 domain-containing protein [Chitinophaga sp.]HVI45772.1 DUF4397 domain-containing protein [Chitinophaga sp.]
MKHFRIYIAVITLIFSSCSKSDYLDVDGTARPPLYAYISFANARVTATPVNFWTFTQQVTTAAVPVNQASPYLPATYGNVQINVTESGGTSYKVSRQFGNSAAYTENGGPNGPIAGFYHTVFAAPRRNDNTKDTLILFYDDLSAPASGKAKLRFVNLAPGAGNVQLQWERNGVTTPLFNAAPYGSAGSGNLAGSAYELGPFINVDAGVTSFSITAGNTKYPLTDITLQAGKIYTLFAHGAGDQKGIVTASVITHQ